MIDLSMSCLLARWRDGNEEGFPEALQRHTHYLAQRGIRDKFHFDSASWFPSERKKRPVGGMETRGSNDPRSAELGRKESQLIFFHQVHVPTGLHTIHKTPTTRTAQPRRGKHILSSWRCSEADGHQEFELRQFSDSLILGSRSGVSCLT